MTNSRSLVRGTFYGLLASMILWLVLAGTIFLFRRSEPDLFILLVGIPIWGITWAVAGAITSAVGAHSGWGVAGALCGVIVGVLTAGLMIAWPTCDYGNVIDKARWAIPYALLTPTLPIFLPLNWLFQHVISGRLVDSMFLVISATLFWGLFGAMLGRLIGRGAST